jgi:PAS domain S-box-containing protein
MLWPLLIISVLISLLALTWAASLLVRFRDRCLVILCGLLALIAAREILDLAARVGPGPLVSPWQEVAGLAVSMFALSAVMAVRWQLVRERAAGSERGRIEAELRASRARFSGILEIAEDAIISVNSRQEIVLFNRGAEKIFGYNTAEMLGQPLNSLIPPRFAADHPKHMDEFAHGPLSSRRMGDRREVYGLRKDGTEFPADVSISKLDVDGSMLFTAIVRDASERRRHEAEILKWNQELEKRVTERTSELRESNRQLAAALAQVQAKTEELQSITQQLWHSAKLASVGELAASIAHELNNPLGIVTLRLESVLAQTPADDPRRKPLEIVEQELERMAGLIANVLQFSRRGKEEASSVDICAEIRRVLELTHHHLRKRNIQVQLDFAPDVPILHADRQKLRQVILNLISNAGDAMPRGGRLTPRVRRGQLSDGRPAVVIEIADTGVGIPPEHLAKVMDPFFTTKEEDKGTGLGLAICRRIINEHSGTITIDSEIGRGTTVRMLLPVANGRNSAALE